MQARHTIRDTDTVHPRVATSTCAPRHVRIPLTGPSPRHSGWHHSFWTRVQREFRFPSAGVVLRSEHSSQPRGGLGNDLRAYAPCLKAWPRGGLHDAGWPRKEISLAFWGDIPHFSLIRSEKLWLIRGSLFRLSALFCHNGDQYRDTCHKFA
jgi:hypothetical protein